MNPGPFCPNAAFRRSPVRFDVIIANFRAYSKRIPCVAGGSSPCPPYPAGRLRGERLGQIENRPATMTRLERPFGIHLIKSNLNFRGCGRAGSILSQIILDNTSAADQIPKDARGRFITRDGTVFQRSLFDDRQL